MKISRQVGQTSTILGIFISDATVSTGAGLANLIGSTINFSWIRNNQVSYSTGVASTAATTGTYSTSGFTQVHSSQAKGLYHFCPPDDLFVSGDSVLLLIYGTTGAAASMAPLPIEIELTRTNNQQYASSTRFGSVAAPVGVSTITVGVNASTVSGLAGVSTITVGVNASTVSGLAGVSTLSASSIAFSTVDPGAWPLFGVIDAGISQSTTANSIQLRSGFSATTSALVGATILVYSGTADIWDRRVVTSYVAATDLAGVDAWNATPETSVNYVVFATPQSPTTLLPAVNLTQIYGSPAVTTSAGTLGVANSGLVGVSTITLSAASTITQGVNATTIAVGLLGVSTITLSAASTITQGVNASTVSGLVGISSMTLGAASTVSQGVRVTTFAASVSSITTPVTASSVTGLVGVSTLTGAANTAIADAIYASTLPEGFRTVNAPGTLAQLQYEILANLVDFSNSGTTKTLNSVTSHTGAVATYGYDSSSVPSSITRTA